nr:hypothetical protein [Aeromicrobium sp.]
MSAPYPEHLYPGCPCYRCDSPTWGSVAGIPIARMCLCPTCGNKRCPGAMDHDQACSGSNEPGQPNSLYPNTS